MVGHSQYEPTGAAQDYREGRSNEADLSEVMTHYLR